MRTPANSIEGSGCISGEALFVSPRRNAHAIDLASFAVLDFECRVLAFLEADEEALIFPLTLSGYQASLSRVQLQETLRGATPKIEQTFLLSCRDCSHTELPNTTVCRPRP